MTGRSDLLHTDRAVLAPDTLKGIFRHHPAGVAVLTTEHDGRLVGFTATSVISVSADPPLLAFSVHGTSSSWPAVASVDTIVVNLLSVDQVELSARFATSGIDRFRDITWDRLPTGEPYLPESRSSLRCQVLHRTAAGASHLVVLLALDAVQGSTAPALVYTDRTYHRIDSSTAL